MEYNHEKIGKRIRDERKKSDYPTQEALAEKLCCTRQLIAKWEKGESLPDIDFLDQMCNIFHCEIGYLLCEFDVKSHEIMDLKTVTDLSSYAVESIVNIRERDYRIFDIMNQILKHECFYDLLKQIFQYAYNFNDKKFSIPNEDAERIAEIFDIPPEGAVPYLENASKELIESKIMNIVKDISVFRKNKKLFSE
ncbi:MAG: helix-turn-helix domain-containing protein [Lachnospiraceae bacterium]|nr:helix-turn-helix domain-containing protein [Lachnospiraceae bacterium]